MKLCFQQTIIPEGITGPERQVLLSNCMDLDNQKATLDLSLEQGHVKLRVITNKQRRDMSGPRDKTLDKKDDHSPVPALKIPYEVGLLLLLLPFTIIPIFRQRVIVP